MFMTIYGLFDEDRCYYVGSAERPKEREKQHRRQLPKCASATPNTWEMKVLSQFTAERRLDAMRAEGYWILHLSAEGHPVQNETLEGWPKEAMANRDDWWPVIAAWACSVGIRKNQCEQRYFTLDEAATATSKSKQYVAMCARDGRIPGAVQIQGRWSIPQSFALTSEPIMANRVAAAQEALKLVAKGMTPYAAAKKVGIALSTIYRALKREREKQ
jgi:predicted GIY-YIG superfamily endonuclease